ncbi:ATP-dependent zinc metalloprotease FtsH [bacterium HR17]|jgi:cell division protease FtsH|uniref:ATP-dependent zinc metalloprotease FtsH n=1 Tax=Candidatus Fervidibacter japonicus TaxID=2035412 RepID=A0A2H5XCC1_9BACT|nr:ATP-dependent zinc metalloprotease FtsH [bacterium HR17]
MRVFRWLFILGIATALLFYLLARDQMGRVQEIRYDQFVEMITSGRVRQVEIGGNRAWGVTQDGMPFTVQLPEQTESLTRLMLQHKVPFRFRSAPMNPAQWQNLIVSLLVMLGFLGIFFFLFRQMQAGSQQAFNFARSRARRYDQNQPRITFDDVADLEEAKEELREIIEFLKNPQRFQALGAKVPKGVLLMGPPGCGKTLLARAVAGEAGVPFFHVSGSEFVEMFVGVGAARVRDLFEQAKASRPCIVFLDELDAVGRLRFAGIGGGHDEREQTLNQLLVEMDGMEQNSGLIVIAATNRPDVLDPALTRPGRFDRRIIVDNPDLKGREAILRVHLKGKPLADDVDITKLAKQTAGFSGADLANMVNEAAILAARRGKSRIDMNDLLEALEKVIAGPERKSRLLSEKEKRVAAYHESGHALVSKLLGVREVTKVTIIPRGMALGYTLNLPQEDRYLMTKQELLDEMTVMLAGRAAEELVFGEITTGAANDLERVTELARRMVCEFGMSERLGPVTLGRKAGPVFLGRDIVEDRNYSEEIASEIDREVRRIVEECYNRAKQLLTQHRAALETVAQRLLEKETLDGDELTQLLQSLGVLTPQNGERPTAGGSLRGSDGDGTQQTEP